MKFMSLEGGIYAPHGLRASLLRNFIFPVVSLALFLAVPSFAVKLCYSSRTLSMLTHCGLHLQTAARGQ